MVYVNLRYERTSKKASPCNGAYGPYESWDKANEDLRLKGFVSTHEPGVCVGKLGNFKVMTTIREMPNLVGKELPNCR